MLNVKSIQRAIILAHTHLFEASGTPYKTPTSNTFQITPCHHLSVLSTHDSRRISQLRHLPAPCFRAHSLPQTLRCHPTRHSPSLHTHHTLSPFHSHHRNVPVSLLPPKSHHGYSTSDTRRALLTTLGPRIEVRLGAGDASQSVLALLIKIKRISWYIDRTIVDTVWLLLKRIFRKSNDTIFSCTRMTTLYCTPIRRG